MKRLYTLGALLLAMLNLLAIFYLNFQADMPPVGHFVILPWLLLQAILLAHLLNHQGGLRAPERH